MPKPPPAPTFAHVEKQAPPTAEIFVAAYMDNAVIAFPPGAHGNVSPSLRIGEVLTASGVARDSKGRLYVTNGFLNTISIFAPGADADTPPIATIRGGKTRLEWPAAIAFGPSGKIYVTNVGTWSINVYPANARGDIAPIATIRGTKTDLHSSWGVAVGSHGRIYVTNGGGASKFPASVNVYAPNANGNVAPIAIISGRKTGLLSPTGIAVGSDGAVYVADEARRSFPSPGNVKVYAAGSNGDVAPIATIRGANTGLYAPQAITLGPGGRIYVANYHALQVARGLIQPVRDSITVYTEHGRGDVAPVAKISGPDTGLNWPDGIALGPSGKIYVANTGEWNGYPGTVTVYPATSSGNVKPLATIDGGPKARISNPGGIALDSRGNIYVTNGGPVRSSITVYPAGTDHNVPPSATLMGSHVSDGQAIAVDSKGNLYVGNLRGRSGPVGPLGQSPGSIAVYPAGSNGNVRPKAIIEGLATGLAPTSIAVDANGNIYAANMADVGSSLRPSVTMYRAHSSGNTPPIATITGQYAVSKHLRARVAMSVALDSRGRIYIANSVGGFHNNGSVMVYPRLADLINRDVKPIATIAGRKTRLARPMAIAVDSLGRIYVLNVKLDTRTEVDRITVYPALGKRRGGLDEAPIATIEGSNTEFDGNLPTSIAVWGPAHTATFLRACASGKF